jgi:AraC-like DNA-binding protein
MLPFFQDQTQDISINRTSKIIFPMHLHQALELAYCESGCFCVSAGADTFRLGPGDIACFFPNTVHSYPGPPDGGEQRGACLIFIAGARYFGRFAKTLETSTPVCAVIRAEKLHPDVAYALHGLYLQYKSAADDPYVQASNYSYVELIIARLLQSLELTEPESSPGEDLTRQIMYYIEEHYQEHLSLGQLAARLNVSRYYLSRIFSSRLHSSFSNYVNEMRLNCAVALIREGLPSLTDVWTRSGFESQRTFNRVFLSNMNKTPREYMLAHRAKAAAGK